MRPAGNGGLQCSSPHSYHGWVSAKVGGPIRWMVARSSSHKENQRSVPAGVQIGFPNILWDTRRGIAFCFTPFQNVRSDHKFTAGTRTVFHFSILRAETEEGKKQNKTKSVFLILVLSEEVIWNNIASWVFSQDVRAWMFWGEKTLTGQL